MKTKQLKVEMDIETFGRLQCIQRSLFVNDVFEGFPSYGDIVGFLVNNWYQQVLANPQSHVDTKEEQQTQG